MSVMVTPFSFEILRRKRKEERGGEVSAKKKGRERRGDSGHDRRFLHVVESNLLKKEQEERERGASTS